MTKLSTRISNIQQIEGFEISVKKDGTNVDLNVQCTIGDYAYKYKAMDKFSVSKWIKNRFEQSYPGYTCRVLDINGTEVRGNRLLGTVRSSYAS